MKTPAIAVSVAIGCLLVVAACNELEPSDTLPGAAALLNAAELAEVRGQVDAFCGNCHLSPEPAEFPRRAWADEVDRGYELYRKSGRTDLVKPPNALILRYYRQLAPDDFEFYGRLERARSNIVDPAPLVRMTAADTQAGLEHAVANVLWDPDYPGDDGGRILFCDMDRGEVGVIDPRHPDTAPVTLAKVKAAAHIEPCDLDRDGHRDYLVADLGETQGLDVLEGAVFWLRNTGTPDAFELTPLYTGLAHTCDARAGDFDGDGDPDVIVAEFGYLETGRILLLENISLDPVDFRLHEIDARHGAIHTIPADMNGDGHLDVVALVSQEYETVDVFINRGVGPSEGEPQFERRPLYRAATPTYGSSGIELVDMDADGDLDILYTNGDSFDGPIPKLLHSVQWLRQDDPLTFSHHHIAYMPGVHRAVPLDIDADGDIDIAAVSMLPHFERLDNAETLYDSVTCFINQGDQTFERCTLETRNFAHPTCVAGDFDGDGDADLAVGNVGVGSRIGELPPVDLWENTHRTAP